MKTKFTCIKAHITKDMIGKYALIPVDETGKENIKTIENSRRVFVVVNHGGKHNLLRHDLFWSCLEVVSENTGMTKTQIAETCKIDSRWYKGFTHYKDKHGNDRINVITRSIAFDEMTLAEANEFYSKAFDIIAGYIGVSTDKLIEAAKEKMGD